MIAGRRYAPFPPLGDRRLAGGLGPFAGTRWTEKHQVYL